MQKLLLIISCGLALALRTLAADEVPAAHGSQAQVGVLDITCPDSMEAMCRAWVTAFNQRSPGAGARYTMTDCNPIDRSAIGPNTAEVFSNSNQKYTDKYSYDPFRVLVSLAAYDLKDKVQALGVFVHRDNPLTKITLSQLDAIYSTTRRRHGKDLTTWGQLGLTGEWADQPIHPISRKLSNEVTWHFRDIVMLDGTFKSSVQQPQKAKSVDVIRALSADRYGIANCAFSYATAEVKALALTDSAGVEHQPSREEVGSGSYPLIRPLYFYVNRVPGKPLEPLVKEFLSFVLSAEGQTIVAQDKYFALPPALADGERAKLD